MHRQRVASTVVVAAFTTNVISLCSFPITASFPHQQTQLDYQITHSHRPNELSALPWLSAAHYLIEPAFLPQFFTDSLLSCSITRLIQACTLAHVSQAINGNHTYLWFLCTIIRCVSKLVNIDRFHRWMIQLFSPTQTP